MGFHYFEQEIIVHTKQLKYTHVQGKINKIESGTIKLILLQMEENIRIKNEII